MHYTTSQLTQLGQLICKGLAALSHCPPQACYFCFHPGLPRYPLCRFCERDLLALLIPNDRPIPLSVLGGMKHKPAFDHLIIFSEYIFPFDHLITQYKFHDQLWIGRMLGRLLAPGLKHYYQQQDLPDAILPVPLHYKRQRERGFNQVTEIAYPIAKTLELPLLSKGVIRQKNTQAQSTLDKNVRGSNMKNAFACQPGVTLPKHIAILDDVITTGNTVVALTKVLKENGVEKVTVWGLAHKYKK